MHLWTVVLYCFLPIIAFSSAECRFSLVDHPTMPLIFKSGQILNPSYSNGTVILRNYDDISLFCPGENNFFENLRIQISPSKCFDNKFWFNNRGFPISSIKCSRTPEFNSTKFGNCNLNAARIGIGFLYRIYIYGITFNRWYNLIELCFDETSSTTYWTKHILLPFESSFSQPTSLQFKDDFERINAKYAYASNKTYQAGHLTPRGDFHIPITKRMTNYYINAAPQIDKFNNGNWKSLEGVIRTNVKHLGLRDSLTIYTGTTGATGYYLGNLIPINQYFWKVVVQSSTGRGIAFVGVNDVQHNVNSPCNVIRCDRIRWLGGSFIERITDFQKGTIYCCTIESLKYIQGIQLPSFYEYRGGILFNM